MKNKLMLLLLFTFFALPVAAQPVVVQGFGDSFTNDVMIEVDLETNYTCPSDKACWGSVSGSSCEEFVNNFLNDPSIISSESDSVVLVCGTNDALNSHTIDIENSTLPAMESFVNYVESIGLFPVIHSPIPFKDPACSTSGLSTCNSRAQFIQDWIIDNYPTDSGTQRYGAGTYYIFLWDPLFPLPAGDPDGLYASDGIHPMFPNGRDLVGDAVIDVLDLYFYPSTCGLGFELLFFVVPFLLLRRKAASGN